MGAAGLPAGLAMPACAATPCAMREQTDVWAPLLAAPHPAASAAMMNCPAAPAANENCPAAPAAAMN